MADPIDAGSYLATYFIHKGHEAEHFAWANKQVFELYGNGRGFEERHHAHTSLYFAQGDHHRDVEGVPAHMALDHPYDGLVSIHVDRDDGCERRRTSPPGSRRTPPTSCSRRTPTGTPSPIDQVIDWRPIIPKGEEGNAPMKLGTGPGTKARSLQLCLIQDHPTAAWERITAYADLIDSSGPATVRLVAPFVPTIPGTDTYTDQLW